MPGRITTSMTAMETIVQVEFCDCSNLYEFPELSETMLSQYTTTQVELFNLLTKVETQSLSQAQAHASTHSQDPGKAIYITSTGTSSPTLAPDWRCLLERTVVSALLDDGALYKEFRSASQDKTHATRASTKAFVQTLQPQIVELCALYRDELMDAIRETSVDASVDSIVLGGSYDDCSMEDDHDQGRYENQDGSSL
ncbi:hypothetical protein SBRCBS47491_005305 [Sporothrix bragantina]|uniref:Uncharacterized protein n=1 Tax=Sporothrix bragantina TaxID=671064 RepID=A0ABP0BWF4_9PEZI